jgi:hypothetical protein
MSHFWSDRIQVPGWLSADLGWPREWWWLTLCADVPGRHLGTVSWHHSNQLASRKCITLCMVTASVSSGCLHNFAQAVLSTFSPHTQRLQRWRTTGVPRYERLWKVDLWDAARSRGVMAIPKTADQWVGRVGLADYSPLLFFDKLWLYRTMRPCITLL